ncbi:MAG: hypothetical protein MEP57_07390 [Microvirga sp.]|nr:hypothetical protein [Microvirga sp.]
MTKKRFAYSAIAALLISGVALTPAFSQNLEDSATLDEILRRAAGAIGPAGGPSGGGPAGPSGDSGNNQFEVAQSFDAVSDVPPNSDDAPASPGDDGNGGADSGSDNDDGGGDGNGNGQGNGNGNGNGNGRN